MNREERRSLKKQGASQETIEKMGAFQSPCTISECVQISRASAEDVLTEYHRNQSNVQLAMSIQIEILKEIVFKAGLMTEDDFKALYMQKAKELQDMQRQMMESESPKVATMPNMEPVAGDVEIKIEE